MLFQYFFGNIYLFKNLLRYDIKKFFVNMYLKKLQKK